MPKKSIEINYATEQGPRIVAALKADLASRGQNTNPTNAQALTHLETLAREMLKRLVRVHERDEARKAVAEVDIS